MIAYSTPRLSDLYTLSHSKLLENHTFNLQRHIPIWPYMAVPPGACSRRGSWIFVTHIAVLVRANPLSGTFLLSQESLGRPSSPFPWQYEQKVWKWMREFWMHFYIVMHPVDSTKCNCTRVDIRLCLRRGIFCLKPKTETQRLEEHL